MRKLKYYYIFYACMGIICILLVLCGRKKHPGYNYMPDMTYSNAYETYVHPDHDSSDIMTARLPVEGAIPRGYMPYHYPDSTSGYELAGKEVTNPLKDTDEATAEGKRLFNIFCAVCHGESGEGNGVMVENEKFPAIPPSYLSDRLLNLPEGKMFHTITYGKNMMGSHASQLNKEERWKIITYVRSLQKEHLEKSHLGL